MLCPSVCRSLSSVTLCIVAKRCVLEHKLLLRTYRKSYMIKQTQTQIEVLHNSSHTGSGIIVYGLSLKLRILRLIEVVHRRFSKRKHILRQLTCWCAIFSGNIPASCDRAYRSARRLRNGRGYKPCLSIIYNVIDKQRLRIRLHIT